MILPKKLRFAASSIAMAAVLTFSSLFGFSAYAENNGVEILGTEITVRSSEIKDKGAYRAIQAALDIARYSATNDNAYKVIVEPGEYDLTRALHIYSNTELYLKNVKLSRNKESVANMLRTGDYDTEKSGATGYDEYCNMTVTGGVFDGGNTSNTVIKAAHSTNLTFNGTTFKNVKNGHIMEIAGIDGFNVKKCTFTDQKLDPDEVGYEAIQLDILKSGHIVDCRSEDLAMKNVSITDCTFENVPRGIGTHTMVLNNPFDGIKIKNNKFRNITSAAIQTMNWKNCEISGNTIENTPRGISVYTILGSGMGAYKSSAIAKEGGTKSHCSDSCSGAFDSNIVISGNTINGCGGTRDKFAEYEPAGITVNGNVLSKVYSKYPDGSGALPKGDYSAEGVTVKNNTIDVKGYGIRMINAKDCSVTGNILKCGDNKNYKNDFHGIQVVDSKISQIKGNSVSDAGCNGISVYKSTVPVLESNEVDNAKYIGICCDSSNVRHINYNTIIETGADGILFKNSTGNKKITENYVTNAGTHGIYVKDKAKAGTIEKNTVYGCKSKAIERMKNSNGSIGDNYFKIAQLKSISLNTNSVTMGKGERYPLSLTLNPSNAKSKFIWKSSDSAVASVDSNGVITANKNGKAKISVKASDNISKSCEVEVKDAPESVSINADMLTLGVGEEFDLDSTLSPKGSASQRVDYSSNNKKAVSVSDAGGVITGKAVGTATIVASTYNKKIDNCNVIVKAEPYAVWFTEDWLDLGQNETYSFKAQLPEGTASNYLVYSSSNPNIIEIDSKTGEANAKLGGMAEITATAYNGLQAHCTVNVVAAPEKIELSADSINLKVGETNQTEAFFPQGSNACSITYFSSDPGVCRVDKYGLVTAVAKGSATISARTYNGRIAFCKINVKQ